MLSLPIISSLISYSAVSLYLILKYKSDMRQKMYVNLLWLDVACGGHYSIEESWWSHLRDFSEETEERAQIGVYIHNVSKGGRQQVWFPVWYYRKITEPLGYRSTVSFQVTGGMSLRGLWDPGLFLSVFWAQLRYLPASVSHLLGWNEHATTSNPFPSVLLMSCCCLIYMTVLLTCVYAYYIYAWCLRWSE